MESTRSAPSGSASSVAVETVADHDYKGIPIGLERGSGSRKLLARMIRVMFPHPNIPDEPYIRAAEAVLALACEKPGRQVAFAAAIQELMNMQFEDLDDAAALSHLQGMAGARLLHPGTGQGAAGLLRRPRGVGASGLRRPQLRQGRLHQPRVQRPGLAARPPYRGI